MSERLEKPKTRISMKNWVRYAYERERRRVARTRKELDDLRWQHRTYDYQMANRLSEIDSIRSQPRRRYEGLEDLSRDLYLDPVWAKLIVKTYRDLEGLYLSAILEGASKREIQRLRKMQKWEKEKLHRRLRHGNTRHGLKHIRQALLESWKRRRSRRNSVSIW